MRLFERMRRGQQIIGELTHKYEDKWTDYLLQKYGIDSDLGQYVRTTLSGEAQEFLRNPRIDSRHRTVLLKTMARGRFSPWEFAGWDKADEAIARSLQQQYARERRQRLQSPP
ncbi:MAG TPA: hypothetical protein VKT83_03685 [bacterium]|nr:hypothetical protein [bacterium]